MQLLTPELGLFFWQLVTFLLVVFLLTKYAWKPILQGIKKREEEITHALAAAEKAREEMQRISAENEKLLQEARIEKDQILKKAQETARQLVDEAKENAKKEANRMIEDARRIIESEKNAALSEIKAQIATLSVQVAERILKNQLSEEAKQKAYIEELLKDIKLN
ncbi:MAG: ATP synthase subunit b [Thermonema sp.]|jgi:F-type H+-transporting ATPase subunit b|uniref:F0F1 ATP synthase subunit B n=1 Tax=Thermonema TaxID=28194 RepID=UPI00056FEF28|nr:MULTISPECIES: F0F1 ATP synthase subunit B [Thermonema]GIV40373.1 MAG: ATP synthase subunit b [Thermonema sp.]